MEKNHRKVGKFNSSKQMPTRVDLSVCGLLEVGKLCEIRIFFKYTNKLLSFWWDQLPPLKFGDF